MSAPHSALADLATHYWKLCESLAHKCAGEENSADAAMLRYSRSKLDAILGSEDMELRCYAGQEWGAALPTIPINPDEICGESATVLRTIEPTILRSGNVLLPGKVMLTETQTEKE